MIALVRKEMENFINVFIAETVAAGFSQTKSDPIGPNDAAGKTWEERLGYRKRKQPKKRMPKLKRLQ